MHQELDDSTGECDQGAQGECADMQRSFGCFCVYKDGAGWLKMCADAPRAPNAGGWADPLECGAPGAPNAGGWADPMEYGAPRAPNAGGWADPMEYGAPRAPNAGG